MCDTQAPNLPSVCVSLFLFLSLSRFTHSLSMFMLIDAFLFYGICVSTGEPLTHSLLTNIHIHAHMCVYENEWEEKRYLSRDFLRSWPYGFRFTRTFSQPWCKAFRCPFSFRFDPKYFFTQTKKLSNTRTQREQRKPNRKKLFFVALTHSQCS